ncbi:MAG: NAD(P)/FAD-dependent oxidoreductase [Fimbriimonadaceae bacterium]
MRVAVVGAGVSGLAAARTLLQRGHEATIYERSSDVGGRCTTYASDGFIFDQGATTVAPRDLSLERVMLEELPTEELVVVDRPVYTHDGSHVRPGDASRGKAGRYCYRSGIQTLARLLAANLDVRLDTPVEQIIKPSDGGFAIVDAAYDAVVLAVPAPLAAGLLQSAKDGRRTHGARYRPCISVMLGVGHVIETPYFAAIEPDHSVPLTWLSNESAKVPGARAPEGCTAFVAQLGPSYSQRRFEASDDLIVSETLVDVERLLHMEITDLRFRAVERWGLSQPEGTASFTTLNPPGERLVLCGDWTLGGRVELAYESGVQAADHLVGSG